ncbi:MAG: hypothetical protein H6922_03245 [Pseudomonadaceae bacterium]|nr:hypothetical protein [Pseudomonadaceae bacterium]
MKPYVKALGIGALGLLALVVPGTAKADGLTVVYSTGTPMTYRSVAYHPVVYHRPMVVQRVAYVPRHWHHDRGYHRGWDKHERGHDNHGRRDDRRGHR